MDSVHFLPHSLASRMIHGPSNKVIPLHLHKQGPVTLCLILCISVIIEIIGETTGAELRQAHAKFG